jgi:ferritin-like protein
VTRNWTGIPHEPLVRNAAAERAVSSPSLRVNLIELEGESLKQIVEDARTEDHNHFEPLVPHIFAALGGRLPDSTAMALSRVARSYCVRALVFDVSGPFSRG